MGLAKSVWQAATEYLMWFIQLLPIGPRVAGTRQTFATIWFYDYALLKLCDKILQRADAFDCDANHIPLTQSEIVRRNETGTSQQENAGGES